MRYPIQSFTISALSLVIATTFTSLLSACGGNNSSTQDVAPKIKFTTLVTFGDSLSDVGTYKVGAITALGGGRYVNNTPNAKLWNEIVAEKLGLSAPCAAQTGLDGDASKGFSVAVKNNAGCLNYAQGGARVTHPVGSGNQLLGGANATLGALTVPVVQQIDRHLAVSGGKFSGTEIVLVFAGANDAFIQASALSAAATQAATDAVKASVPEQIKKDIASGTCQPSDAQASNCIPAAIATLTPTVGAKAGSDYAKANAQTYVDAMGKAGTELAGYVNQKILANGAKYVVVVGIPDLSKTPSGISQSAESQTLLNGMSVTFNARLMADIIGKDHILYVDSFTRLRDFSANPSAFGISNMTTPACDLSPAKNPLGSSLVCNQTNLISGDTSKFFFADGVHPTAYGYQLLADYVMQEITNRKWN